MPAGLSLSQAYKLTKQSNSLRFQSLTSTILLLHLDLSCSQIVLLFLLRFPLPDLEISAPCCIFHFNIKFFKVYI